MNATADRLAARCLGTALAVAACDPPAAFHGPLSAKLLLVLVAAVAWWAAPMSDQRPVQTSVRWAELARRRGPTLLAAGSVALAAATDPPVWIAACVTALLPAYLLTTDPSPARRHPPGPALITAAACALVFTAAQAPFDGTSWSRLLAAATLAATTACLALALTRRSRDPE